MTDIRPMPADFSPDIEVTADGKIWCTARYPHDGVNGGLFKYGFVLSKCAARNAQGMLYLRSLLWKAREMTRLGRPKEWHDDKTVPKSLLVGA